MHYRKSTCVQSARCFSSAALHIHSVLLFFAQGSFAKKKKVCKINKYFCKKKKNLTLEIKCYVLFANLNPLLTMGSFTLIVTPTRVLCSQELLSLVQLPLNSWADHITSLPQFAFFFFFFLPPNFSRLYGIYSEAWDWWRCGKES